MILEARAMVTWTGAEVIQVGKFKIYFGANEFMVWIGVVRKRQESRMALRNSVLNYWAN